MFLADLLRMVLCLVFAFSTGVCLVRAVARHDTVRAKLIALACSSGALFALQLSLFNTPLTYRTAITGVAALGDIAFLVALFWRGPSASPDSLDRT